MEYKDMTIEDIEKRAIEIRGEMEAEDADLDALTEEVKALEERKAAIKAEAEERAKKAEEVAKGVLGKTKEEFKEKEKMSITEIRNSQEYIEAFAKFCKTGDEAECRALLTENATGGVLPVPTFVEEIVASALQNSKILARTRKTYLQGNVKVPFEYAAPAAAYHTEGGAAINEEALSVGVVELKPQTLKKWVGISDEALDSMNGEAYLRYIYEEIARGIVKARENAIVSAILSAPQTATATAAAVAKTGSAAGAITDIVDAIALLGEGADDLVCIMTKAQYATYKGLQMAANYGVDPFDGLEVLFNESVTAPIVGDLNGILENLPKGDEPQIKYDDKTRMKQDLIDVLGRLPHACGVVGNKFFAKVSA